MTVDLDGLFDDALTTARQHVILADMDGADAIEHEPPSPPTQPTYVGRDGKTYPFVVHVGRGLVRSNHAADWLTSWVFHLHAEDGLSVRQIVAAMAERHDYRVSVGTVQRRLSEVQRRREDRHGYCCDRCRATRRVRVP